MSDDDDDFGDPGADGEPGGGSSLGLGGACLLFCVGLVAFPCSLALTGWNEQRSVCRSKAVVAAEDSHIDLMCDSVSNVQQGDLGFLDCSLDVNSFKNFTQMDFPGVQGMTNLFAPHLPAVGVTMEVDMMTCKERCVREECVRRLTPDDEGELADAWAEEEADEENGEQGRTGERAVERSRLARRLNPQPPACANECVEYGYWMEWSSEAGPQSFHDVGEAQRVCQASSNPIPTGQLEVGRKSFHAPGGAVTVQGGAWRLSDWQLKVIPIEEAVPLASAFTPANSTTFIAPDAVQPPASLTDGNAFVQDNMINSCQALKLGCVRVSFRRSFPHHVMALGGVSDVTGTFSEDGWVAPDDWLCSGWDINRICPMDTSLAPDGVDLDKGVQVCGETESKDAFFEQMHSENTESTMVYRFVFFLVCWGSCCMVCSPITTILRMAENCIDGTTECIPCVGCIVDQLTDALVGTMYLLIGCATFMIAGSCFLAVMAVTWVVMRPLYGLVLSTVACSFCCCAAVTFQLMKQGKRGKPSRRAPRASRSLASQAEDGI